MRIRFEEVIPVYLAFPDEKTVSVKELGFKTDERMRHILITLMRRYNALERVASYKNRNKWKKVPFENTYSGFRKALTRYLKMSICRKVEV